MVEGRNYVPEIEQLRDRLPILFESITGKEWVGELISRLIEHSRWTFEHSIRVAQIVCALGNSLKMPDDKQLLLARSGLLHDIGKLQVPVETIDTVALDEAGRKALDNHPRIGFDILKELDYEVARIIVAHHEFQERSYPRNRIRSSNDSKLTFLQSVVALADATDALLSERPYKPPWSPEDTRRFLENKYDPSLIEIAIDYRTKM